jgi:hypothetical protein
MLPGRLSLAAVTVAAVLVSPLMTACGDNGPTPTSTTNQYVDQSEPGDHDNEADEVDNERDESDHESDEQDNERDEKDNERDERQQVVHKKGEHETEPDENESDENESNEEE